ncbi:hypothetical protein Vafri_13656 [Volvox africanus]|uniref:Uncharacterized protein n=1 Tax=Volvox africanus TaxID=51714 RepID=A0A8J4F5S1_9CHLO|nr:hypothetical protein Vafri_13656 [Volvox africanus]
MHPTPTHHTTYLLWPPSNPSPKLSSLIAGCPAAWAPPPPELTLSPPPLAAAAGLQAPGRCEPASGLRAAASAIADRSGPLPSASPSPICRSNIPGPTPPASMPSANPNPFRNPPDPGRLPAGPWTGLCTPAWRLGGSGELPNGIGTPPAATEWATGATSYSPAVLPKSAPEPTHGVVMVLATVYPGDKAAIVPRPR